MWARTIDYLKDHLSPDTIEKYGPLPGAVTTQPTEIIGQEVGAEGTGVTGSGETVERGEAVEIGETVKTDEKVEGQETIEREEQVKGKEETNETPADS